LREIEDLNNKIKKIVQEKLFTKCIDFKKIETGLFNDTYIIKLDHVLDEIASQPINNDEIIIRIAPPEDAGFLFYEKNMMAQEPSIHSILLEKTSVPVPRIYFYDNSKSILDRGFLIMEKLEGTTLSQAYWATKNIRNKVFKQMGVLLKEIHQIHEVKYGYLGEHHPMEPQETWWDAFSIMWKKMLRDIYNCKFYTKKEVKRFEALLEQSKSHFQVREGIPSSLLHMDVWAQNILINKKGEITGVVDWDRALWGDPEIEFAVLDYCGISYPPFWEGYGLERNENLSLRVRDLFYLLYEHQKYIPINVWRRKNLPRAQAYKNDCIRLFSKLGELLGNI